MILRLIHYAQHLFNMFKLRFFDRAPRVLVVTLSVISLLLLSTSAGAQPVSAQSVLTTVRVGSQPIGVAVNPSTNRIYVANNGSSNVSVIDGTTNIVITTIPVGSQPIGVAVNPSTNRIYVANSSSSNVSVIDGTTNTVIATIPVGSQPIGVAVNPSTNRIYVAEGQDNGDVYVIDGTTNTGTAIVPGLFTASGVAVNASTNRIYAANNDDGNVYVIDGTNNTHTSVPVSFHPTGVSVNASTNRIYVACEVSNTAEVIDGVRNTRIAIVPVGSMPYGVAVNASTNLIYITNTDSNNVSIIDGSSSTLIATLPIGNQPHGVAVNASTGLIYLCSTGDNRVYVLGYTPTVTSINPASGYQRQSYSVRITGTDLVDATSVSFGSGITVNNYAVDDGTGITANITIAPDTAPGPRDISVTTPAGTGTKPAGFTVNAPTTFMATTPHGSSMQSITAPPPPMQLPSISVQSALLSAAKVAPGVSVTVTAHVTNTGAVKGSTRLTLYVNGQEESSQGVTVSSGSNMPVTFTLTRNDPGIYSVYVSGVSAGSFTVDQFADPNLILYISGALILLAFVIGAIYVTRRRQPGH